MIKPAFNQSVIRLSSVIVRLLSAWAFAAGLVQLVLRINKLAVAPVQQSAVILLMLIVAASLTWTRYQLMASGLMIISAGFIGFYSESLRRFLQTIGPDIQRFSQEWLMQWLSGSHQRDVRFEGWLTGLILVLITWLSYLLIARFNWPAAGLIALVVTAELLLSVRPEPALEVLRMEWIWLSLPTLSVVVGFARSHHMIHHLNRKQRGPATARLMLQALPPALAMLLLTALILPQLPATTFYSHHMEGWVDDWVSRTGSGQARLDQYPILDISRAGYRSLFDRLGGPVQLSDDPILRISGYSSPMLLKTAVAGAYDGQRWQRSPDRSLLRFDSPMNREAVDQAFDLSRPPYDDQAKPFLEPIAYRISPIGQAIHSIPLAGRPLELHYESDGRYQYLFSDSGQMISKYWLRSGEIVQIEALRLRTESLEFSAMVRKLGQQLNDQMYAAQIRQQLEYLTLPDRPEYTDRGTLTQLTANVIAPYQDSWDRAMAIRGFLLDYALYDLEVEVPPDDVEFVSWFLETRRGYCVYFATAMTMMSRLAGIPARYVEGFYSPDASAGWRLITGQQAHAWTEVFMPGAGWIPIDATPGFSADPWIPPTPGETEDPSAATPTPGPVQTPSASPSEPMPSRGPAEPPESGFNLNQVGLAAALLILLLVLILIRLLNIAAKRHRRLWLRARLPDSSEQALYYRQQIENLLSLLGQKREPGESLHQWIRSLTIDSDGPDPRHEPLIGLASRLDDLIYSGRPVEAASVERLAEWFDRLEIDAKRILPRSRWIMQRILRPDTLFFRWKRRGPPS